MASFDDTRGGASKSWLKWVKLALVALGLALVLYVVWWAWNGDAIARWKSEARPLPFFGVMALVPAFGIPFTPLFILAGATFSRRVALIGSLAALAANLALCYWIARSGLRRWLRRLMRRFDYELPDFEKKGAGAWRLTLMMKLAPGLPTFVKNYSLGVAGVPFALYFCASMLITGAYGVALIVLGESLFQHQERRSIIIVAAVVVLALAVWLVRRRKQRHADG